MYMVGSVLLPEFQRGYVWNRDQVRGLMRSLYRGYPVGGLLTWETQADGSLVRGAALASPALRMLTLDGQQRITSLALPLLWVGFRSWPWRALECRSCEGLAALGGAAAHRESRRGTLDGADRRGRVLVAPGAQAAGHGRNGAPGHLGRDAQASAAARAGQRLCAHPPWHDQPEMAR